MAGIRKLGKKTKLAIIGSVVTILMLILVTPAFATNVNIWGPDSVHTGENLDFWVQIDIHSHEQIPIDYIQVDISGAGSAYVKFNPNGNIIDHSINYGEDFTILSASFPGLGYGYGYCPNWGYGYGYSPEEGYRYYDGFGMGYGYGYGYGYEGYNGGYYPGVVSLIYNIQLNTASMPLGLYDARTSAHLNYEAYPDHILTAFTDRILEGRPTFFTSETPYPFVIRGYPGITVTPTSGLVTTEAGGSDTFTIVLDSQPTADVTIGLSSSDTTEGTVSPSSVTFTSADWDSPQTVTVTGVDDTVVDGNVAYTIITAAATSTDPDYNDLDADNVSVINNDNDGGGGGGGGGGDTTPPVILNVKLCPEGNTETTATICWTTYELSTSQVEYWASPSTLSPLDTTLVINHHVGLTDLTPGTTYHYKAMSKDNAGNLAVSTEYTFTTLGQAPAPPAAPPAPPAAPPAPPVAPPAPPAPPAAPPVTPEVPKPINWPVIGGIIAGVVVIAGLLAFFLTRRRRRTRWTLK